MTYETNAYSNINDEEYPSVYSNNNSDSGEKEEGNLEKIITTQQTDIQELDDLEGNNMNFWNRFIHNLPKGLIPNY